MSRRREFFAQCDADTQHQRLAGIASWTAFSARWRARQGLPLLHSMDVQYLTPHDFCNGRGQPLPASEQRRLFRAYVSAAIEQEMGSQVQPRLVRRPGLVGGDLSLVRSSGFQRRFALQPEYVYGRDDLLPYDPENITPTRPYGVPLVSETFAGYWLDGSSLNGNEDW
jgi:hypothetical protein